MRHKPDLRERQVLIVRRFLWNKDKNSTIFLGDSTRACEPGRRNNIRTCIESPVTFTCCLFIHIIRLLRGKFPQTISARLPFITRRNSSKNNSIRSRDVDTVNCFPSINNIVACKWHVVAVHLLLLH